MLSPAAVQTAFAACIKHADARPPTFLQCRRGTIAKRFDVYRNNVYAGLSGVIAGKFPAVRRIVGEVFFSGLARQFIERDPPRSPALIFYGGTFAAYIRGLPECEDVPYLADVAEIEWELHRCAHAADEIPLRAEDLRLCKDAPGTLTFRLASCVAVLSSNHPAYSLWQANACATEAPISVFDKPESTLITRPHLRCDAHALPAGGYEFTKAIAAGVTLAAAAQAGTDASPKFALDQVLGLLIRQNAICQVSPSAIEGVLS